MPWEKYKPVQAFLVALDISGFSIDLDPDMLSHHRMNFFHAVEQTPLFARAKAQGAVQVHFLGDELRLAFEVGLGARETRNFIRDVFAHLEQINRFTHDPHRTRIKGVVFAGAVTWETWQGCDFLNGVLPIKAQTWMEELRPNQVAIDEAFRQALQVERMPTDFPPKSFGSEVGYMLRSEVR